MSTGGDDDCGCVLVSVVVLLAVELELLDSLEFFIRLLNKDPFSIGGGARAWLPLLLPVIEPLEGLVGSAAVFTTEAASFSSVRLRCVWKGGGGVWECGRLWGEGWRA